jgi:hypothetical protein
MDRPRDVGGTMLHVILTLNWPYQTVMVVLTLWKNWTSWWHTCKNVILLSFWRLVQTTWHASIPNCAHTQFATTTMSRLEGGEGRGWPFYPQQSRGAFSVMEGLCFLSSCLGLHQRVSFWDSGESAFGSCVHLSSLFFPFWGWDLPNILAHATRCIWGTKREPTFDSGGGL